MADWADAEAVWRYFQNESPKTEKGKKIRGEAMRYIDDITFFTDSDWDRVRSYRNAYDVAEDKKGVKQRFKEGFTTEEMRGGARPEIDEDTGWVGEPEPLIPTKYKIGAAIGAAVIAGLVILKKFTPLRFL